MLLDFEQNHCNITDGMLYGVGGRGLGGWRGRVGSLRQAKPSVKTVWTSYESKKCQPSLTWPAPISAQGRYRLQYKLPA